MMSVEPQEATVKMRIGSVFNNVKIRNSMGIETLASVYIEPHNEKEFITIVKRMIRRREKYLVLGNLTNTLFRHKIYSGSVVRTKLLNTIEIRKPFIYAESGVQINSLLAKCAKHGLGGLEFLAGIPGTVGGAIKNNAGTNKVGIGNRIERVTCIDAETGEKVVLKRDELVFEYRKMRPERIIIISATFKLYEKEPAEVAEEIRVYREYREKTQPRDKMSLGCIFRNPVFRYLPKKKSGIKNRKKNDKMISAGFLIERAGMKGYQLGGARVDCKHANFIINEGGARAEEIITLMERVKKKVYQTFGTLLEEEINLV